MFMVKKRIFVSVVLLSCIIFVSHGTRCSSISLPTREDVMLFKAITPKIVTSIPDRVLQPNVKNKLNQVIIAGSDVFDLALAIESGELTTEFKEKLNVIRAEFKILNGKLAAESKKIQILKAQLQNAKKNEEKARLLEDQTLVMLDMFASMSEPMVNLSVAFKDINGMLVAKLLQVLELIPPIQPYLTVGSGADKIAFSTFMGVKLQEMIKYTQALQKIGVNLKLTFNELRADMMKCKKDLNKSYQSVLAQKKILPQDGQVQSEQVSNQEELPAHVK